MFLWPAPIGRGECSHIFLPVFLRKLSLTRELNLSNAVEEKNRLAGNMKKRVRFQWTVAMLFLPMGTAKGQSGSSTLACFHWMLESPGQGMQTTLL